MTELEMMIACVEHYSHLKNVPSCKVFRAFSKKGIVDMLLESYEIFKDMDMGFFMGMIDGYVDNTIDSEEQDYLRYEERKQVLPKVIPLIQEKFSMGEMEALEAFYLSDTGASFSEDETGLYGKTPEEIFGQYIQEKEK